MAKIHAVITRGPRESITLFKTRIACGIAELQRQSQAPGRHIGAATVLASGLYFDTSWTDLTVGYDRDMCLLASYEIQDANRKVHPWSQDEYLAACRNPPSAQLSYTYETRNPQYQQRSGSTCQIIGIIDSPSLAHSYEVLPLLMVRFDDGLQIAAWPAELHTSNATLASAKERLMAIAKEGLAALCLQ